MVPRKLNGFNIPEKQCFSELTEVDLSFMNFEGFIETKKYVDFKNNQIVQNLEEFKYWQSSLEMEEAIEISGTVVKGFQRGSKQLGVPTANIEMTPENIAISKNLVPGVYAAVGRLTKVEGIEGEFETDKEYPCALSIGWNPVYDNE